MHENSLPTLYFDSFELNESEVSLSHQGSPISLPPKAFAVLCVLLHQPGQLISKDALLDAVWGHRHVSESVLKTTISELRAALSDNVKQPRFIETVPRRGYRFIASVSSIQSKKSPAFPSVHQTFVGRQNAIEELLAVWDRVTRGHRRVVWVAGEAGVGKTTLVDNFVDVLNLSVYAHGQCVEQHGTGEPYLPVLEALAGLCRQDSSLVELMRITSPTWYLQLPWLGTAEQHEKLRRELAGVGQDRMLREFGELLDQYTQTKPLLLITEDLHWCDQATLQLMNHVARRRSHGRLMWVGSFRLTEVVTADHPLKSVRHELRLHDLCQEIALEPFSERDVADYLNQRFPENEISENLIRQLHARTDGLPLFLINIFDDLVARGILQGAGVVSLEEKHLFDVQVPESLVGVIEKHIARLKEDERSFLEVASIYGNEFRVAIVANVLQRDEQEIADICDDLVRRKQWLNGPNIEHDVNGALDVRYSFQHTLYRQVIYQRMGLMARIGLHGKIARALENCRTRGFSIKATEIASHFELNKNINKAVPYYAEAAENALRHFAPQEALDLVSYALGLLSTLSEEDDRNILALDLNALRGIASAQVFGVSSIEAKRTFEHARNLLQKFPQHPMHGLVTHALGLVLMVRGEYDETRLLANYLIMLSESRKDSILMLCACNLLGQSFTLQGFHLEALPWLERGIKLGENIDKKILQSVFIVDPLVSILGALAMATLHTGNIEQASTFSAEAQTRARESGQPMSRFVANWFGALLEVRLQNVARVHALAADLRMLVDESAISQGEGPCRWFLGWSQARSGNSREGYKHLLEAFNFAMSKELYSTIAEVLAYAVEALVLAEEWTQAKQQLQQALQLANERGERSYLVQMYILQTKIFAALGDIKEAHAALHSAMEEARTLQSPWLEALTLVVDKELGFGALSSTRLT